MEDVDHIDGCADLCCAKTKRKILSAFAGLRASGEIFRDSRDMVGTRTVRIWFLEESNNGSTRGATVESTNSSVILAQTLQPQPVNLTTSTTTQATPEPSDGTGVQQRQTITVQSSSPDGAVLDSAFGQGLRLGIGVSPHSGEGLRVTHVLPDSAGQRAGFEVGDVILVINGMPIRNFQDYSNAVDDSPAIMSVTLGNVNDGQELTIDVELEN